MFKKLFSRKSVDEEQKKEKRRSSDKQRSLDKDHCSQATVGVKKKMPQKQTYVDESDGAAESKRYEKKTSDKTGDKSRKISTTAAKKKAAKRKESSGVKIDTSNPLEYPCIPEVILEYHKRKPFLSSNEEWLLVELNEYECLVDSEDIIKVIAKHSKFFEVDPDDLWAEFFEYVESIPAYDEVINYDIWQEFRDEKYPC